MLVPAPWREPLGQAKPYKVGVLQPLTGTAAAGGKTALVGTQLATNRINKAGGINGRPVELVVADYESKPDVGRRKAEKLLDEDKVDVGEGGYLSNVCLACMPVFEEQKTVFMIGVCLDTTITTSKCSRYVFRPFDYAPSQAVAFAPHLVKKLAKKWHIVYLDYAWGQSTRDAYAEQIKKQGGEIVGTTGIPLGTADMTAFISKITGTFDGVFAIMFGANAVTFTTQAFDFGLFKNRKYAGDGAVAEFKKESLKLIEALEGMEVKEGDDFPQGDKLLRREDHQAFLRQFIFDIHNNKHRLLEVIARDKTVVPPACTFPKA